MKRVFAGASTLVVCALLIGCVVPPRPPVVSPPSQPLRRAVQLTIRGAADPVARVVVDDGTQIVCDIVPLADDVPRAVCVLPSSAPSGWGAHLRVLAGGMVPYLQDFTLLAFDATHPDQNLPDVYLKPEAPPVERLHSDGRRGLHTPTEQPFVWKGSSGFEIAEMVAHGRTAEADRYIVSMKPANIFRVLTMAANLFALTAQDGLAALPAALDLAASRGVYFEVVVFADTKSYPGLDYRGIARTVGQICAAKSSCATVEIGNELSPCHDTQDPKLCDVAFLEELRGIVREAGPIPVSLGSTHDAKDESDVFKSGDYLTIHGARANGDEIKGDAKGWRWVRHTNEQRALADRVGRYAVNDEPRRDDVACDKQLGVALLTRMFSIGDTFHSWGGLFAIPPAQSQVAGEAEAFQCRARGWGLVPDDWFGSYLNAGMVGSPVKGFTSAVRVYSSVRGSEGLTLALGAEPSVSIEWDSAWTRRDLILSEGAVRFYKVSR